MRDRAGDRWTEWRRGGQSEGEVDKMRKRWMEWGKGIQNDGLEKSNQMNKQRQMKGRRRKRQLTKRKKENQIVGERICGQVDDDKKKMLHRYAGIATLGSILDCQLSWESGKFQLARWSQEVVLFPERTTHPPTDHMDFLAEYTPLCICAVSPPLLKYLILELCAVSPPLFEHLTR